MPFHWCPQETEALMILLSCLPFAGIFFKRLHARWHDRIKTKCGHENH